MLENDCESVYIQRYSIFVDSIDVSDNPPNYLINFDPYVPLITLYSNQVADLGVQTVVIKSNIELNPSDRVSDTEITFTFEIIDDECLDTVLYPMTLDPVPSDNSLVPSVYPDTILDMDFVI